MNRRMIFVLLLATGVAVAESMPQGQSNAGTSVAETKTEAVQGLTQSGSAEHDADAGATTNHGAQAKAGADAEANIDTSAKAKHDAGADAKTNGGAEQKKAPKAKLVSVPGGSALGMSILGNQEAPKSLVIVPWKSSELGRAPGMTPMLDDSRQPVDRAVFMRALRYYEIRSGTTP